MRIILLALYLSGCISAWFGQRVYYERECGGATHSIFFRVMTVIAWPGAVVDDAAWRAMAVTPRRYGLTIFGCPDGSGRVQ